MLAQLIVLIVLPALLATAAGWDLASYTIPNFLPLAVLGAFAVFAVLAGLSPAEFGWHLLAGLAGLAIGFALFAFNQIGGGDAKLFAAVLTWLGFGDFLSYILMASLLGGALALAMIGLRQLPLPAMLTGQAWISRLHDRSAGIPYGVALAAGALVILPEAAILHLAGA